jgi:hypothetical protein
MVDGRCVEYDALPLGGKEIWRRNVVVMGVMVIVVTEEW